MQVCLSTFPPYLDRPLTRIDSFWRGTPGARCIEKKRYVFALHSWLLARQTEPPSGQIFEKRLILSHLSTSPTDPVTGEDLSADDLIELKAAQIARPRPPTQTSIPALLSTFQNEWDALALEAFALRKQLAQTRQELSTVLYDYEGALRVIARVTKERDEAREALASVGVQLGSAEAGAESMEVDGAGELPDYVVEKVEATQKAYALWFS